MKTLADFKRRIKVGTLVETYNHSLNQSFGIRPVSKVQTNGFALETKTYNGKILPVIEGMEPILKHSWCEFPKAKEVIVNNDYSITIHWDVEGKLKPILTYTFV